MEEAGNQEARLRVYSALLKKMSGTRWRHYKNSKLYCVIGVALDSETLRCIVNYREVTTNGYLDGPTWSRSYAEFSGSVTLENGAEVLRFAKETT